MYFDLVFFISAIIFRSAARKAMSMHGHTSSFEHTPGTLIHALMEHLYSVEPRAPEGLLSGAP